MADQITVLLSLKGLILLFIKEPSVETLGYFQKKCECVVAQTSSLLYRGFPNLQNADSSYALPA